MDVDVGLDISMDTYRYREFLSLHVKPILLLFLQACANILIPSSSHHFNHTISHFPPVMWTLFISRILGGKFVLFCYGSFVFPILP